jgi:hypothetical protein
VTLAKRPLQNLGQRQVQLLGDEIDKLSCGLRGVVQRLIQWTTGACRCALVRGREVIDAEAVAHRARWSAFDPHRRAVDVSAANFARAFLIFSSPNTTCPGTIFCAAQGCHASVQS